MIPRDDQHRRNFQKAQAKFNPAIGRVGRIRCKLSWAGAAFDGHLRKRSSRCPGSNAPTLASNGNAESDPMRSSTRHVTAATFACISAWVAVLDVPVDARVRLRHHCMDD